jgi:hypothetical protein
MRRQTIEARVLGLEERVTELERLPERIDDLTAQTSQFQKETSAEFSAMRRDMGQRFDALETTMHELHGVAMAKIDVLDSQMHELHGVAMAKIDELGGQMRTLHEDVIDRIARMGERTRKKPPTSRKR